MEALTSDLTMVRLAASEAFERRARRLVATLARDVLARELALAPADIEALVGSALAAFAEHDPIAISVAAADADRVRADLPFRIDPQLHPGDLIVHVADGSFESPLAFRLAEAVDGRAL